MRCTELLACLVIAAPLAAQTAGSQPPAAPSGWQWRLVSPGRIANVPNSTATDSTFRFEDMAPGWHVTMGPGGFLYDSGNSAAGRFAVQAGVFAFSDGQMRPKRDGAPREGITPLAADGTVRAAVRVLAEPDSERYFVDGTRVGAWPRSALPVDGVYGFRIGRGANMHITNLDITRRHAPFPARR